MTLKLPAYVEKITDRLEAAGFEAYAVGGCVRDLLRGAVPGDYDVTTSAPPQKIKALFKKTVDTGIKHGTVTVIEDGIPCEVTTFRTEGAYGDHRHPESVEFVSSIKEDLSRRDFTVNAMAYSKRRGLVDLFGGADDLKAKILRTVGDPDTRFGEDALRILRLFRFASALGFSMEENTLSSALRLGNTLKAVSVERIAVELKKAVRGEDPAALSPLIRSGALGFLLIENDRAGEITRLCGDLRQFAFLNLCSSDCMKTAELLKLSQKERRYAEQTRSLLSFPISEDRAAIKRALRLYDDVFEDGLTYLSVIENRDVAGVLRVYKDIIAKGEPYKIPHLAIGGDELLAAGITGQKIGQTLEELLGRVTEDPALNEREKLLKLLN